MELPTEQEFTETCTNHLWLFTMEQDFNKVMEGMQSYHYMLAIIKAGGSKYKKIHRKAFEDFIDERRAEVRHDQRRYIN